ncbi:MAG TPA: transglutaminase domain-containing protein [Bellilinea sp.]|nr:transglutaminase domain-containing protein [Bellilinea sp.]
MKISESRWWDWTAVLCFLAVILTVAFRLSDTKWTEDLNIVTTLTIIGGILGLVLGLSKFNRWIATLIGVGYTLVILPWQFSKVIHGDVAFAEKLASVGGRLWHGLNLFLRNQPLTDSILFLGNMALLFWLLAIIGGYTLTRHGKPWLSVIIGGIAIVIIDVYHPAVGNQGVAMGVYVVFALLLLTRMHFLHRKREWDTDEVSVDTDTGFSWSRGALITAFVLVVLAWNITSVVKAVNPYTAERHQVITLWNDLRLRFENAVKPLRGTTTVPREFYGDQFSLGQGSQLSDARVFTVDPSITGRIGVAYYWRVRSYDQYDNGIWQSTIKDTQPLSTNTAVVSFERYASRVNIGFKFFPDRNLSMLYAPSIPITVSRRVTLQYDKQNENLVDITAIEVDPLLRAGEVYEVVSMVAAPTVAQLRGAETDYPEWVSSKYLQLPTDLPESVSQLALSITEGIDTPYDKVVAVTRWLRENIEYSAVLPQVPQGEDPIEWMLFSQKQAFCNYYATAEILMLRSLGIPARWVVGYAQGEYDPEARVYTVRERDSHAWPEVFFPQYGWVEFEPTASLAAITRPSGSPNSEPGQQPVGPSAQIDEGLPIDNTTDEDPNAGRFGDRSSNQPTFLSILRTAAIIGAILFLPVFALLMVRLGKRNPKYALPSVIEKTLRKRGIKVPAWVGLWSGYIYLTPMERIFVQVSWMLRFLRSPVQNGSTPAEQIAHLVRVLPTGQSEAQGLLEEYQKAVYSPYEPDLAAAKAARKALWKTAIQTRLRGIGDSILGVPKLTDAERFSRMR